MDFWQSIFFYIYCKKYLDMKLQPLLLFITCVFCLIKPFLSSSAQSQTLSEALVEMFSPLFNDKYLEELNRTYNKSN